MNAIISPDRRNLLIAFGLLPIAGVALAASTVPGSSTATEVEVWKDPNCGCCKDWVSHLEANGFKIRVNLGGNDAARARLGIPESLASCHTASVGGYAIEGHVPAREIRRMLREKPAAVGLAVPGMVVGSPGMDGPEYGGRRSPYSVMLVGKNGSATVFQKYEGAGA